METSHFYDKVIYCKSAVDPTLLAEIVTIQDQVESTTEISIMNQSRTMLKICLVIVLISMMITEDGSFVLASGKKKFLKGFILGALLSKGSYPSM